MLSIAGMASSLWNGLFVLLSFLFVLSIVVFIHEMGHFLVARWCGVHVKAFSLGFGREIFAFVDRHGTRWRLAWLPLGGYVKFMDDENVASMPSREALEKMTPEERAGSFHAKPVWQRAAVVAAGPIANFLLAIVIFALLFTFIGQRSTEARIDEVIPDTPAARAGFKPGDLILAIDGAPISSFNDVLRIVTVSPDRELTVKVDRGGAPAIVKVTPETREAPDGIGGKIRRGTIGIKRVTNPQNILVKKTSLLEGVGQGVKETIYIATSTLQYMGDVVSGRQYADQLGGPIRIAEVSGQVARIGIEPLLQLVAVISVSVGLINLFPVPLLDGGHLMFYAIEGIRRRPLSERSQEIGFKIGLAVVLMLMVFSTWNDRLIVWRWVTGAS